MQTLCEKSMVELTTEQIDCALLRVEDGLRQYMSLQEDLHKVDVSKDRQFQKRFNHFYRVRRGAEWQSQFYKLLQENKTHTTEFSEVLKAIKKYTGRYEASFSSKLVASIHPEKPVIDKFVLENVGLKLQYGSAKERENGILEAYNALVKKFDEFLRSKNGRYLVKKFQEKFPEAKVTEVKMVDLVLWKTR
jgi:hypothetical protein